MYFYKFIVFRVSNVRGGPAMSSEILSATADNLRVLSAAMVEKAKSGHPGGPMGGADFMAVLFSEFLAFDPDDPFWPNRDRFFLDAGHMSPLLYSTLCLCGKYTIEELKDFRQWESPTPGHPELDVARGVENTSGPLGQGHAMALGAAVAERFLRTRFGEWMSHGIYAYVSDGAVQEEISQGVGRLAGHLGMSNLIMFYDSNDIQLSTRTAVVSSEDTAKKYEAWGWKVTTVEGNNIPALREALRDAVEEKERPSLIIGRTTMGKGAVTESGESFEGQVSTHGKPLSKAGASFEHTVRKLGGDPENPFEIRPEVQKHFEEVLARNRATASSRKQRRLQWESENPDAAAKLQSFFESRLPEIDFEAIEQKPGSATRSASGTVLSVLAEKVPNMIVSSADLSNSDNTNGFLKKSSELTRTDFSGGFLQAGVSELTMAGVMNGIALHGGVIPVCGTFLVFSDFMKPAVRLAALMELPVTYVWTHDAFRVGEDGPTHQPIEHEAQLRLLEQCNNLYGRRSMLVLRPADAAETSVAWKAALENTACPTALLLSRQPVPDLPASGRSRFADALGALKGAYIVVDCDGEPDVQLVANGSEVATLIEAAKVLVEEKSLKVKVVSAPSEGLFREQDRDYQESVLAPRAPTFGLTAGLAAGLQGLVGPFGKVFGMSRFGASAPYKVLDEKFGFTPGQVIERVEAYLRDYRATAESYLTADA